MYEQRVARFLMQNFGLLRPNADLLVRKHYSLVRLHLSKDSEPGTAAEAIADKEKLKRKVEETPKLGPAKVHEDKEKAGKT